MPQPVRKIVPHAVIRGPLPAPEDCAECPLSDFGKPSRPVRGIGPKNALFVIIGEGPGAQEERTGVPFIGDSGQLLGRALAKHKLSRANVYITNTTMCRPPAGIDKDKVLPEAVRCCSKRLAKELATQPAKPLLLLGKHAAQGLLPYEARKGKGFPIMEMSGTYYAWKGRHVIPFIHPAAILRGGDRADLELWRFYYAIERIKGLAKGTERPFEYHVKIEYKNGHRAAALVQDIAREIRRLGWCALDTETVSIPKEQCKDCYRCSGHDATEALHVKITSIGLATPTRGIAVDWGVLSPAGKDTVRRLFADETIAKVIHNRLYDTIVCKKNGIPIKGRIHCTLLEHHNAFPGLVHRLQPVVAQFIAVPPWKSEHRDGDGSTEELLSYCAKDTQGTAQIHPRLQICVKQSDQERTYAADSISAEVSQHMTENGIPISREVNRLLLQYMEPKIRDHEKRVLEYLNDREVQSRFFDALAAEQALTTRKADPMAYLERHKIRLAELKKSWPKGDGFNPRARNHVSSLFKAVGVVITSKTATGKTSTKKDVLEGLVHNKVIRDFIEWRTVFDVYKTQLRPIPYLVDRNWFIHPAWPISKITGRFGSSPNYQNHSKGKGLDGKSWSGPGRDQFSDWIKLPLSQRGIPNLRWQVVAPPGWVLVGFDFAGQEARLLALLSGDKFLCDGFRDGWKLELPDGVYDLGDDVHSRVAYEIFGDEFPIRGDKHARKADKRRDHTKNAEYAWFYLAQPSTVWKTLIREGHHVDYRTIVHAFKTFPKIMPGIPAWHASMFESVRREQRVREPILGRSRWFPTGEADPNTLVNFPAQSGGAALMSLGFQKLWAKRKEWFSFLKVLINGHDALVTMVKEDKADWAAKLLEDCFATDITLPNGATMNFPIDVGIGKSWAEV